MQITEPLPGGVAAPPVSSQAQPWVRAAPSSVKLEGEVLHGAVELAEGGQGTVRANDPRREARRARPGRLLPAVGAGRAQGKDAPRGERRRTAVGREDE